MSEELKPCPFCGGECDPNGWLGGDGARGPECKSCGATAESVAAWNRRAQPEPAAPAVKPMTAHRAIYFMERFQKEEKLLGPNEQEAVRFVLAMLEQADAAPSVAPEPVVPKGYVRADQAFCLQNIFDSLCDVAAEANAVDTVIGRPDVLRQKLVALRDRVGHTPNGYISLATHPPRAPLTDAEIKANLERFGGDGLWQTVGTYFREGARFAERAHGISAEGERP